LTGTPNSVIKPLPTANIKQLPSNIRTEPVSLPEQLALQNAKNNGGEPIMTGKINDPNYQGSWMKMQSTLKTYEGKTITIHYWYNTQTGEMQQFKFKNAPYYPKSNNLNYWNNK
jgi:hypothetical protein